MAGFAVVIRQRDGLAPQVLDALTQTLPPVKLPLIDTEIDVPELFVMFIPVGTVQVYDVAPLTGLIE